MIWELLSNNYKLQPLWEAALAPCVEDVHFSYFFFYNFKRKVYDYGMPNPVTDFKTPFQEISLSFATPFNICRKNSIEGIVPESFSFTLSPLRTQYRYPSPNPPNSIPHLVNAHKMLTPQIHGISVYGLLHQWKYKLQTTSSLIKWKSRCGQGPSLFCWQPFPSHSVLEVMVKDDKAVENRPKVQASQKSLRWGWGCWDSSGEWASEGGGEVRKYQSPHQSLAAFWSRWTVGMRAGSAMCQPQGGCAL